MMALILGRRFFAISFLASWMKPTPSESESILSIMGREVFGAHNPLYYVLQFSTMAILVLAANTAYADFPRLAAIIGRDGFLPRQFAARGDRLVFSNGVLILAGAAALLLIVFDGDVSALIPLYAVGVFTSFTLSQTGMVRHHLKERQKNWQLSMVSSGLGAVATFVVAAVVVISKFVIGAWIIVVLIPLIVLAFKAVASHYRSVARQLAAEPGGGEAPCSRARNGGTGRADQPLGPRPRCAMPDRCTRIIWSRSVSPSTRTTRNASEPSGSASASACRSMWSSRPTAT